jgi:glycine/D-amino acid oxidase-like deaminating enzyme
MNTLGDAQFIIVGGGAVGCGVAYALARTGRTDVLVLERQEDLGLATTSQGAGLCGQVRDSAERIRLAMHSVAAFRELENDPAVRPDWREVGSLRIALNPKRAAEFQTLKKACDQAGLETRLIPPGEAERLWPGFNLETATAILWCPSDGYMNPAGVVQSYAHYCRQRGVRFATGVTVESLIQSGPRVTGVQTNHGRAAARYVVNAAGAHAYHVARLAGLDLPVIPVRHEYFVTLPLPGLTPRLPCFRIPDMTLYGRVRDGGLLLGGWENAAVSLDPRQYPLAQPPPAIQPDEAVLENFRRRLQPFFPRLESAPSATVGKGWPTFTPDGRFIIGESARAPGFVMAGGCNAHGISGSGGIGRLVVESLFDPQPSPYVQSLSPNRFTETTWNWAEAAIRARRIYETYYGC